MISVHTVLEAFRLSSEDAVRRLRFIPRRPLPSNDVSMVRLNLPRAPLVSPCAEVAVMKDA